MMKKTLIALAVATATSLPIAPALGANVIATDQIIQGSECVGMDCSSTESFSFDTLRLKENNLQIHFDDTSSTGSFPSNDWRIIANDSANGGASYLAIEDSTAGKVPFKVTAGAGANALFISSTSRIGLGTASPAVQLQVTDGNTPTLRLEQDGSDGFTAQSWDVAGNETNFFVRDVTNSSKLSFRIRPNAPTSSIDIAASGYVGMGASSPDSPLHLKQTTAVGYKNMVTIENNGGIGISLKNTNSSANDSWVMGTDNANNIGLSRLSTGLAASEFKIKADGTVIMGPGGASKFSLDPSGNLTIAGALTQASDAGIKENIDAVDGARVLETVAALPISTWNYQFDDDSVRHFGPMAQDFYAAFGLGGTDKGINPLDAASVALAGVKELSRQIKEKDDRIARMETRLAEMELLQVRMQESLRPQSGFHKAGLNGL